jgi:hypothetical protein
MQTFSDGKQIWSLRWTVGVCRRVDGLKFFDGQTDRRLNVGIVEEWLPLLFANPVLLSDLVFAAAAAQHPERTREQLDDALSGAVLEEAREALIEEIVNFTQSRSGRGDMLKQLAQAVTRQMAEAVAEVVAAMPVESPMNGAENSGLTEKT